MVIGDWLKYSKVQEGNEQEMAQSEEIPTPQTEGWAKN